MKAKHDKQLLEELAQVEPITITLNRMTTYGLETTREFMKKAAPTLNMTDEKLVHMGVHFLLIMTQVTPSKEMQLLMREAMDNAVTSEDAERLLKADDD